MNVKYDRVADAVYLSMQEMPVAKTVEISEAMNMDLDAAGKIVGIEILDAANQTQLIENLQNNVAFGIPIEIISHTPQLM